MKIWFLALVLCLGGSALRADDVQLGGAVTGTVQVSGLTVPLNEILVTPKADYVHIIWDSFADRAAIKEAGKAFSLNAVAVALARTLGRAAEPKATLFKVDVAEFPVRDNYGVPRWDKVEFLGRFVVSRKGDKWVVKKRPED
jgi:hypothetical protein